MYCTCTCIHVRGSCTYLVLHVYLEDITTCMDHGSCKHNIHTLRDRRPHIQKTNHLSILFLNRNLAPMPSERKCATVIGSGAIAASLSTTVVTGYSNFETGCRIGGAPRSTL